MCKLLRYPEDRYPTARLLVQWAVIKMALQPVDVLPRLATEQLIRPIW